MQPGKIRLINTGGQNEAGFTQVIANAVGNRVYRITNDGPGNGQPGQMRIRITRVILWGWTVDSVCDLDAGRSVDVLGSTIKVLALETLQLFGSYDTTED
jgi:hypothetical protein